MVCGKNSNGRYMCCILRYVEGVAHMYQNSNQKLELMFTETLKLALVSYASHMLELMIYTQDKPIGCLSLCVF